MQKYYILADLMRKPSSDENKGIPQGGEMYAGKVKAIIEADTWQEAMEAGKKCITGNLRKGVVPFNWSWNEVAFVDKSGDKGIYDAYRTATWLSYYRVRAGLTQKQLSEASGVNIRQIQRVELGEAEAGNLTARNLLALADALGVDARELI